MTTVTNERMSDPEVLSIAQCARLLGLTEKAVRRRIARRHLPFRRFGRRIIIIRAELLAYLDQLPGCRPAELLLDNAPSVRVR